MIDINQLTFSGQTAFEWKVQAAIERMKTHCPPEGAELAFSGGKDSICIEHLARRAEIKFTAVYKRTGIDPPEVVRFISEHYREVLQLSPKETIWHLIDRKNMLPLRTRRYCCEYLKEWKTGISGTIITGVRWAESSRRAKRCMYEICKRDGVTAYLHPIIDWSEKDVWHYIRSNGLSYPDLYDEGWKRLGCVLCPMGKAQNVMKEIQRWPKLALAWKHAAERIWKPDWTFPSGEAYFHWWLSRKGYKGKDPQCLMFHD